MDTKIVIVEFQTQMVTDSRGGGEALQLVVKSFEAYGCHDEDMPTPGSSLEQATGELFANGWELFLETVNPDPENPFPLRRFFTKQRIISRFKDRT